MLLPVLLLSAALCVVCSPRAQAQGGEPRSFAIQNAKVVPVSSAPLDSATVVVVRGVITAVGTNVAIPADALVIDGKGLIVYPGLFDAFSDVGVMAPPAPSSNDPNARPPLSRGPEDRPATTPWRNAADEVNPGDPRIESWRGAGFTTTLSAPKAGMFPGMAAVLDLEGERSGDLVVKTPVAVPVSLTAPGGFRNYPGSTMGGIAYVRQVWLDTNWSTEAESAYNKNPRGVERPRYDRTDAVLSGALEKHAFVLLPANTSLQIRRVIRLSQEWKLNSIMYGGQMAYDVAPEIAASKIPVLVDLKWPEAAKDADPEDVPSLRTLKFRDRAPSSPAALDKAGVKFAFYSAGITAPKELLPAVKKAIDAGLPADAALRALTLSPAEILGVSNVLGSIETGKIANLVVTDGDLFEKKTKIKMVFVDGRKFAVPEPLRPAEPPKGDLSGKWKLAFTTPEGPETATADLSMDTDGTLTGTVTTQRNGTSNIFSGYMSEDKFNFTITLDIDGDMTDVHFTGTYDGTAMKGTIGAMSYKFDFTGTKAAAAPGGAL
jgi:imidazolonepropionase-like amidohydrolase